MEKEELRKINHAGDFIHKAFCVEGETKFVKITAPNEGINCHGSLFEITDKKRGLFYVGIYKPIN